MSGKTLCLKYGIKLIDVIKAYKELFGIDLKKSEAFFREFNEVEVKLILEKL